jgi:hypothetical protein
VHRSHSSTFLVLGNEESQLHQKMESISNRLGLSVTETMMQGKPMKTRLTEREVSKTQYTIKYESSTDGGNTWTSDLQSTFTKVKAAAPAAK